MPGPGQVKRSIVKPFMPAPRDTQQREDVSS